MKKTLIHLIVLCVAILTSAILLHALDLILKSEAGDLNASRVSQLLSSKAFWQSFPTTPPVEILLHLPSLLVTSFVLGHAIYIWGVRKQLGPLPFGLVIWTYGLAPTLLGYWLLVSHGGGSHPGSIWQMMFLSPLASSLICGLSVLLGMVKIDVFKTLTRVPLPHVHFKTQPVAES